MVSARQLHALRTAWEVQGEALERETQKSKLLEKGLRAMARSQGAPSIAPMPSS